MKRFAYVLGTAASAAALSGIGQASETITYKYDPVGRLVRTSSTGTVNNGVVTGITFDHAGNRCNYNVAGSGGAAAPAQSPCNRAATPSAPPPPPPPPPPPEPPLPPPPGNQPPTTAGDVLWVQRCQTGTVDVVANDSDPENNVPITLVSVTEGTKGSASVSSSTTITYEAGMATGGERLTYTVRDSFGAASIGFLDVNIGGGTCEL